MKLPPAYKLSMEAAHALDLKLPVVALESAVITHGLPHPHNLSLAQNMEADVRAGGAVPVTIAVLDGKLRLGLEAAGLERLARDKDTGGHHATCILVVCWQWDAIPTPS